MVIRTWFKVCCMYCGVEIDYCGCSAEMFGPGHDEEHCVCVKCEKRGNTQYSMFIEE